MAITKQEIDYSDFHSTLQANKLRSNSIRKTFEYDRYAGKNSFVAIVLSKPVAMTSLESDIVTGAPRPKPPAEKGPIGTKGSDNKTSKYGFRARILGPDSPHTFLPNPCDSREFTKAALGDKYNETRDKLIAMHTMFYTDKDFSINGGGVLPSKDDYVEVFLVKGDHGYDLQKGVFKGSIVNKNDVKQQGANLDIAWSQKGGSPQEIYKKDPVKTGPQPLDSYGKFAYPVEVGKAHPAGTVGDINSRWYAPGTKRERNGRENRHCGTDYRSSAGDKCFAVADGNVVFAGTYRGGGRTIVLKHDEKSFDADPGKTVYSVYMHLQSYTVTSGKVKAGQEIGKTGTSGTDRNGVLKDGVYGPHLHIELWIGDYKQDGVRDKCGIPPGFTLTSRSLNGKITQTTGPTANYTIDFVTWLAEQQTKANMPGALVGNTKSEGADPNDRDSIEVEGSDAGALLEPV